MFKILEDILKRRNIKDITQMSTEEKAVFDGWQKVSSANLSSMTDICPSQNFLIFSTVKSPSAAILLRGYAREVLCPLWACIDELPTYSHP